MPKFDYRIKEDIPLIGELYDERDIIEIQKQLTSRKSKDQAHSKKRSRTKTYRRNSHRNVEDCPRSVL